MNCKLCGLAHRGWVSCAKAKSDALKNPDALAFLGAIADRREQLQADVMVANAVQTVANKHGVYADKEKRKTYMRELMRKRRAK